MGYYGCELCSSKDGRSDLLPVGGSTVIGQCCGKGGCPLGKVLSWLQGCELLKLSGHSWQTRNGKNLLELS
eukprot:11189242-Prorocentrum_lima.AAC.1